MSLITNVDILQEAKECFLTYSEEVLTDRAIPAAEDGLLSAQRKILWTMEDYLKMDSNSKTKKCNAIVGSTLATSYYHGDASCYGVLRKMAQPFLMRYPLIAGQGQLGTQENNDMFSSSRYTEAKPSNFADLMMNDYNKEVVPVKETYNGEYMEPVILPSLFPNAICNGRQSIGISMAHSSLSHNLTEVCNAAIALINEGSLTIDEVMQYLPGPDFPLGGVVLNSADIRAAYETGKSAVSLKVQGDYEINDRTITFTTIPYRTYRNKIKEQIEKNIDVFAELFEDFNDESEIGKNKLVFKVKAGVPVEKALNQLFIDTDLQTTLSYNMNYIVNGTPILCSMGDLLSIYVQHQEDVLIKATTFDMEKAKARAHILRGLIAAVDKIDEVITLIKQSASRADAKEQLEKFLIIDDIQANAILEMRLGKLTRIDKKELVKELAEKEKFIARCEEILNVKEARDRELIRQITWLRDTYGDARRTKLTDQEIPKAEKVVAEVEVKDCFIIVTEKRTVKRVDIKHNKPVSRPNDPIVFSCKTNTQDFLMVFTSKGVMRRISVDSIPEGTNTSTGSKISILMKFDPKEIPMAYTTVNTVREDAFALFITNQGLVKKTTISEYLGAKRSSIIALSLKEGDSLHSIAIVNNLEELVLISKNGECAKIKIEDINATGRSTTGTRGMKFRDKDTLYTGLINSSFDSELAIVSEEGLGKRIALDTIPAQVKGIKGTAVAQGPVKGAFLVKEKDILSFVGDRSSYEIPVKELPISIFRDKGADFLKDNSKILSVSRSFK